MNLEALFIGSIGVLAETSDIQRRAYNQALTEAGVDWHWDAETYRDLLARSGGRARLTELSEASDARLSDADIERIHARKTEIACDEIVDRGVSLRPGVARLVSEALHRGIKLALVTTTQRTNIDAIAAAAGSDLPLPDFSAVLTVNDVNRPKPAPDVYRLALQTLGVSKDAAIAIEDSAASVASSRATGIYTIATPGDFTSGQDFGNADRVLESLEEFSLDSPRG
ncbi:MAG: HAD-IA family hydrolase [Woeseiaceae bacterium]|nr:HAD-IA family hydrolase [Woeseiaceae bacterium]